MLKLPQFDSFFLQSALHSGPLFSRREIIILPCVDIQQSVNLVSVNAHTVSTVLTSLSNSKTKDVYSLDTIFLKQYKDILTTPNTNLINHFVGQSSVSQTVCTVVCLHSRPGMPCEESFIKNLNSNLKSSN